MTDDLTLDGNGMAGLLREALMADPSTLDRTCQHCGRVHALGEHRAFRGAGVVLRCPSCSTAAVLIGVHGEQLMVQTRGTFRVTRTG